MSLTRDEILDALDLPTKVVQVPEWGPGGIVYVRTLTGLEVEATKDIADQPNFLGCFAAAVLCDETGKRLFTDEDAAALGGKSHAMLIHICEEAQELNGLTKTAREKTEKN